MSIFMKKTSTNPENPGTHPAQFPPNPIQQPLVPPAGRIWRPAVPADIRHHSQHLGRRHPLAPDLGVAVDGVAAIPVDAHNAVQHQGFSTRAAKQNNVPCFRGKLPGIPRYTTSRLSRRNGVMLLPVTSRGTRFCSCNSAGRQARASETVSNRLFCNGFPSSVAIVS